MKSSVPGAHEVSVTFVENRRPKSLAATGRLALDLDERQYERGYGPCLASIDGSQPVRVNSTAQDPRWPEWAGDARRNGAGSVLSIPVPVQREVSAALNLYSTEEHAFDDTSRELAQIFAACAGVALDNMHMYEEQGRVAEQLQTAMQSRSVIEQAKGILMGARRCGAEEAFDVLVKLSQDTNRKLRDVAQALVDEARTGTT